MFTSSVQKGIITNYGILDHYNKVQLREKGHESYGNYSFALMPLLTKNLSRMMAPDKQALVSNVVPFLDFIFYIEKKFPNVCCFNFTELWL